MILSLLSHFSFIHSFNLTNWGLLPTKYEKLRWKQHSNWLRVWIHILPTLFFFYISDVSSFDTGIPLTTTPSVQLYSKLILVYIIFTFSLHIFSSAYSPRAFIPIAPLKMLLLRSPYKSPHSQIQRKVFFFISLDGLYSNRKSWPYPSLTWKFPWFPSYSTLLCFFLLSFALPFLSSPSPQIR